MLGKIKDLLKTYPAVPEWVSQEPDHGYEAHDVEDGAIVSQESHGLVGPAVQEQGCVVYRAPGVPNCVWDIIYRMLFYQFPLNNVNFDNWPMRDQCLIDTDLNDQNNFFKKKFEFRHVLMP